MVIKYNEPSAQSYDWVALLELAPILSLPKRGGIFLRRTIGSLGLMHNYIRIIFTSWHGRISAGVGDRNEV